MTMSFLWANTSCFFQAYKNLVSSDNLLQIMQMFVIVIISNHNPHWCMLLCEVNSQFGFKGDLQKCLLSGSGALLDSHWSAAWKRVWFSWAWAREINPAHWREMTLSWWISTSARRQKRMNGELHNSVTRRMGSTGSPCFTDKNRS